MAFVTRPIDMTFADAARRAICVLLAALAPLSVARAQPQWASDYVARWEAASHAIGSAPDASEAAQRCGVLIRGAIDVGALTDAVAAEVQAGASQRQGLEAAVRRELISDCVRRRRDYAAASLSLLGVRTAGQGAFVTANVSFKTRPAERLIWRVANASAPQPKAADVIAGGRSLSRQIGDALTTLLRSRGGDLDRAIDALGRTP